MPVFTINTNVDIKSVPEDFKKTMTDLISKSLCKHASYIAVHVNANQDISFGGTEEPAALCDLVSIGALSKDVNKHHSKAIMSYLEKSLGVSPDRTYISFHCLDKTDVGFNKTTFDNLM